MRGLGLYFKLYYRPSDGSGGYQILKRGRRGRLPPTECYTLMKDTHGDDNDVWYIYAGGDRIAMVDNSDDVHYYLKDHLGTTRATIRDDGTVSGKQYEYYAFGETKKENVSLNQEYKYTGKPLDDELDLDIYYYGARYYPAGLGRWIAVDPMRNKYPSWSPYNYCNNNPLKNVDPDGNEYYESIMVDKTLSIPMYAGPNLEIPVKRERFKAKFNTDNWVRVGARILLPGIGHIKYSSGEYGQDVMDALIGVLGYTVGKAGKIGKGLGRLITTTGALKELFGMDSPELVELYNATYGANYKWKSVEDAKKAIEELRKVIKTKKKKKKKEEDKVEELDKDHNKKS